MFLRPTWGKVIATIVIFSIYLFFYIRYLFSFGTLMIGRETPFSVKLTGIILIPFGMWIQNLFYAFQLYVPKIIFLLLALAYQYVLVCVIVALWKKYVSR